MKDARWTSGHARYGTISLALFVALGLTELCRARADEIAVVANPADVAGALRRSRSSDRAFASDLLASDKGVVMSLTTPAPLPTGRYRLHLPLSIAPCGHPACRDLSVTVKAGDAQMKVLPADLPESERPEAITLPFTAGGGAGAKIEVSWQAGRAGREFRLKEAARTAPKAAEPGNMMLGLDDLEDDDLLGNLEKAMEDVTIELAEIRRMPVRLLVRYPVVETLSPLAVTELRPNKILYDPGEEGTLSVTVRSFVKGDRSGTLAVAFRTGLGETKELTRRKITAGPGGETVGIPFTAHRRWGCEVIATLERDGRTETFREYFGAAGNFWEMGIGHAYPIFTQGKRGRSMIASMPRRLRGQYSNWIDLFFWAPCDWSRLTPPGELWWSGQTSYPHEEENLHAFVDALQKEGIRVAAYVSRNPAGPLGWETARQHPEWFGGGRFSGRGGDKVEILDRYNDPKWRATLTEEERDVGWFGVKVDLTQMEPLDYGIDQIIASINHYGWDAVRFDGHYTTGFDPVSTRNMRRLKERVLAAHPGFRLGFNWGRAPAWRGGFTHELREAMAGGGMYMQEGIRHWNYTRERYRSWSHYGENELRIAKRVCELGGSYHCILSLQDDLTPAQRYYKLVHSLIAGAHPAYGTHHAVSRCPNWGAFMTRWAELLWHPHLRRIESPETLVRVDAGGVKWKPFAQECVVAPDRRRLVVHLLSPPTEDDIDGGLIPPPVERPIPVTFTPPRGETIEQVWLVRHDRLPFGRPLRMERAGPQVSVSVPRLQHWAMVVAETAGSFSAPPTPPSFTEPPDLAAVTQVSGRAVSADPNKEADAPAIAPADGFERLLNKGSANIGNPLVADPDSPLGTVQGRRKEQKKVRMGMWWIGAPVGGYEVYLRVKWTDDRADPTPQRLETRISATYKQPNWHKRVFVTPGHPDPPEGAVVLKERGTYHDYKIATIERWWDGCFCFITDAHTAKTGNNQIFQERVIFKRVRIFSDEMLEAHGSTFPAKPAGLRRPVGKTPEKVFVKAGVFWKLYMQDAPFEVTPGYELPGKYDELYRYDAVVLANVGIGGLAQRKMIRDYVADGGRLVLLGGNHGLKYDGLANTFVSDILPFRLLEEDAVIKLDEPAMLGPTAGVAHTDRPALFWRHVVEPRPEAETLVWAGDVPLSFRLETDAGVVTAFTGTPLGRSNEGETPFWETGFWHEHLNTLVKE